jgi:DNA adenine methylase
MPKAKPFLKWVGGKKSILTLLMDRMPSEYSRYIEPFIGGGALYFELSPPIAVISDVNTRLISTYTAIRDNVDDVISLLQEHKTQHSKEYYYAHRDEFSLCEDSTQLAAWMIYYNKTCFNGVFRVNKSNKFNVPIGSYINPRILDEENLRAASTALKGTEIYNCSFDFHEPQKGDFFYLDPPYHETYGGYTNNIFDELQQAKLAEYCKLIDSSGGRFIQSNSDTKLMRELYNDFSMEIVSAPRYVSGNTGGRGKKDELIIKNY